MIQWMACLVVTGLVVQDRVSPCCYMGMCFGGGSGRNGAGCCCCQSIRKKEKDCCNYFPST